MKETKTAKASKDCPTLLHYVAKVLLRTDANLVNFMDDMPHVEGAARGKLDDIGISRELLANEHM